MIEIPEQQQYKEDVKVKCRDCVYWARDEQRTSVGECTNEQFKMETGLPPDGVILTDMNYVSGYGELPDSGMDDSGFEGEDIPMEPTYV
jgi:hypothetical protein